MYIKTMTTFQHNCEEINIPIKYYGEVVFRAWPRPEEALSWLASAHTDTVAAKINDSRQTNP